MKMAVRAIRESPLREVGWGLIAGMPMAVGDGDWIPASAGMTIRGFFELDDRITI